MGTTRLILVEGMIGAGKTTTAEHIADWLTSRGEQARAYHEFAEDHPIRTRAVDGLRVGYPGGARPIPGHPTNYGLEQWARLAESCCREDRTVVLESTFLQNSVIPAFVNGAPPDELHAIFTAITTQLAPATPLLIYLRPTDITAAINHTHEERGEPWSSWNVASATAYPWARARNLSGRAAVIELYRGWERMVDELLDGYPFEQLVLLDPQADWTAARTSIHRRLRGADAAE
ncbi:MAG TPA: hypothetical protein VHW44_15495 [Pseudonocardiaceae bacterium]|jgi:predicted kinase|nr:hypothetical protein [Pseudonocardiaceae bacterium]